MSTPQSQPPTGLSVRAYARHRGTSAPSVLRAIKSGRLSRSLTVDHKGKAKIANVELADLEWQANTDLSKAPGYVKDRSQPQPWDNAPLQAPVTNGKPVTRVPAGLSSLAEASAREKDWNARLAELKYLRESGELVELKPFEAQMADDYARCRTKLLGIASKAKHALPHLTLSDIRVIDGLVREVCEELAGPAGNP